MNTLEYRVVDMPYNTGQAVDKLNELGRDYWQVIHIDPPTHPGITDVVRVWLMREVQRD